MAVHISHLFLLTFYTFFTLGNAAPKIERYIVTIDAHEEECFFERVNAGYIGFVQYAVTEGGFLDIDFKFIFSNGSEVAHEKSTSNFYQFNATEDDKFSFCFNNKFSTLTPKVIRLTLATMHYKTYDLLEQRAEMRVQNITVESLVEDLLVSLSQFDARNYAMLADVVNHHIINDRTNSWILWWAVFEALMLVALTTGQVYYIKKYFEVRRFV